MARVSTPAISHDSEEGREFLQRRVGLFGGVTFLIFAAIYCVGATASSFTQGGLRAPPLQLIPVAGLGVTWLACRRGRASPTALEALDAVSTILAGLGIALVSLGVRPDLPLGIPMVLAMTHLVIVRAVTVPSDPRRTAWISTAAVFPTMVALAVVPGIIGGGPVKYLQLGAIMLMFWCVLALVVATLSSHILYGLRQSVKQARRLGQYTLEALIGEGGMGVVYRARHALLKRPTAIKLLPPEKAGQNNVQRFEREVQLTSQLSHPNTIAIYDFGRTHDGIFYYVMEYLDGIDLEKLIGQEGPMTPARVVHVLDQVCGALAEAHARGLIHRDIKPGNVILCQHGGSVDVAKVVDFGLVKELDRGGKKGDEKDDLKVTNLNTITGTPLYLSPEAITDPESVDARSDIYALGAVGYFMLTAKVVFEAKTVVEVCSHHLHSRPMPPSERVGRTLPADLEAILLRCLEKSPDARPADARVLRNALRTCADAGGWSDDMAQAWWSERQRSPRLGAAAEPGAAEGALTMDIDLRDRGVT